MVAVKAKAMSLKYQASGSGMQGIVAEVAEQTGVPASGILATATAPPTSTPEGGVGSPSLNREGNGGRGRTLTVFFVFYGVVVWSGCFGGGGGVCISMWATEPREDQTTGGGDARDWTGNEQRVKEGSVQYKGR